MHTPDFVLSAIGWFSHYPVRSTAIVALVVVALSAIVSAIQQERKEITGAEPHGPTSDVKPNSKDFYVELFENRDELNTRNGGLSSELARVRHAWVMWPAAGSVVAVTDERLKNIEKLLLMNPNLLAMEYAETFKAESADAVTNAIKGLTKRAQRLNIPILWYPYPYLGIVINDPSADTAWARIELLLPGIEAGHRPSVKVIKSIHPALFGRLIKMYEYMWGKAMKPF